MQLFFYVTGRAALNFQGTRNRYLTRFLVMGTVAKSFIMCTHILAQFFTRLVVFFSFSQVTNGYRVWEVKFPVLGILLRL